ncbi:SIMPL domain-containing protein [Pedobacter sp. SYP-B3415]|uniref:SIMPL domain-containing protein n=1 Tax=Pedobacter sp. SYP-B3415 TaxID=2496641 RepID=UPI00101C7A5F|nr:SIMPL domain-containing protein [Pedobacter sp. SYP-B3415]
MKKFITLAIATIFSLGAMAQQADLRKKITVTGNSEIEVTPDIIYVNISLKEYLENNNSKRKVDITKLENQLYAAVQKAGIAKENLTVNNLASYNYATEKKKNPDFLASKQYRLKVSDLNKFNSIIGAIDPKGISNTNIDGYDYSKLKELRKDMKIKALMDAKEKATYMVEALGNKLGGALDIQDLGNDNINQPVFRNYAMAKTEMADSGAAPELDFKKIKLTYNINVVFEIR